MVIGYRPLLRYIISIIQKLGLFAFILWFYLFNLTCTVRHWTEHPFPPHNLLAGEEAMRGSSWAWSWCNPVKLLWMRDRAMDCASGGNWATLVSIISLTPESAMDWADNMETFYLIKIHFSWIQIWFCETLHRSRVLPMVSSSLGKLGQQLCALGKNLSRLFEGWGTPTVTLDLFSLSWLACAEERGEVSNNLPVVRSHLGQFGKSVEKWHLELSLQHFRWAHLTHGDLTGRAYGGPLAHTLKGSSLSPRQHIGQRLAAVSWAND